MKILSIFGNEWWFDEKKKLNLKSTNQWDIAHYLLFAFNNQSNVSKSCENRWDANSLTQKIML